MLAVTACCSSASLYAVWTAVSSLSGAARVGLTPARTPRLWFCTRRRGALIGDRAPSPNSGGTFEGEARHGMREALERELAHGLEVAHAVEHRHGLAIGEDLAGLRLGAEPRGEVGDVADRGIVPAAFEADRAERGVALRDADAEAEIVAAALFPVLGDRMEGIHHRERTAHSVLRRPLDRHGVVEEHHDRVAREAFERALMLEYEASERGVIGAQKFHHFLGLRAVGEGGEAAQVE